MSEICPICCKNHIQDDPEENAINVRVYAQKGVGTTVHTRYFDIPTYACVDCHKKITGSESTELLLFILAVGLFGVPTLLLMSGDRESFTATYGLMLLASMILLLFISYKANNRVNIHPDSTLNSMSNVILFDNGKQVAKTLVRSDKAEFWWIM